MKLNDDHQNMILGFIITGVILMGIFGYFYFHKASFNGMSDREFCEDYVKSGNIINPAEIAKCDALGIK